MSTVRFIDCGVMCDHATDGALDCYATVYASTADVRTMSQLRYYLRGKGWAISPRRGRDVHDLCPLHSGKRV